MNYGRVKASHCCKNVCRVKMAATPLTQVSPLLPGHLVHVCSAGMWRPACLQGHFQFKNRLGVTFPPHTAVSLRNPLIFVSFSSFFVGVGDFHAQFSFLFSRKFPEARLCLNVKCAPICACMVCVEIWYEAWNLWEFLVGDNLPSRLVASTCRFVLVTSPPH